MTERKGRGCGTRKWNKWANGVKKVGEGEKKEEVESERQGEEGEKHINNTAITGPVSKGSIHQGNPHGAASPQRDQLCKCFSQAGHLCWDCICQNLCAKTKSAPPYKSMPFILMKYLGNQFRSRWFCVGWDPTIHWSFFVPTNPFITCWAIGSSWWHNCSHLLYFWLQKPLQNLHDPDTELAQNLSDIWEQRGVRKGQKKGGRIEEKNALV